MRYRGLKDFTSNGKRYVYHRATGVRLCPDFEYGSPDFIKRYDELERTSRTGGERGPPQTLGDLVRLFKESSWFTSKKERTKKDYMIMLDHTTGINDMPLKTMNRKVAFAILETIYQTHGWHKANYVRMVCNLVFRYATAAGHCEANPFQGTQKYRRPKGLPPANRKWEIEEIESFRASAPPHLRLPFEIALYTGWREGDVLRLRKDCWTGGKLRHVHAKSDLPVLLTVPSPLASILAEDTRHDALTICANSKGRPWTEDGFRTSFFKQIAKLEGEGKVGPGLTFHGLRHTVAEWLASEGFGDREVQSWLGHRSPRSTEPYTKRANTLRQIERISGHMSQTNPFGATHGPDSVSVPQIETKRNGRTG